MKRDKEKVLAVAQEIHFAKALAANDKQLRQRALRRLNKWLTLKSKSSLEFTEEGFMRIWKGLFYCVWMSDKPLVQEDTVESIAHLLHCLTKFEDALSFMRCFYQAMSQAWFGLDQHRLDKYMMLVRRFVRQSFVYLRNEDWATNRLRMFSEDFHKALTVAPVGFIMHLADVYIVELSKVGEGKLRSEAVVELVKPWARLLASQTDIRLINAIRRHVFLYLIRQTDLAISHEAKFNYWKNSGFPGGDIGMIEEVEAGGDDDDSDAELQDEGSSDEQDVGEEEVFLDPRAGRADTVLPPVDFQPGDIVQLLHNTKTSSGPVLVARQSKSLTSLIDKFKELDRGKYPLGIHKVERPQEDSSSEDEVDRAIQRLSRFEERIYEDSGSSRKRKCREELAGRARRRDSSGCTWDVSDSASGSSSLGGISLSLSPHSFSSSPWTVDEVEKNGVTETREGVTNQIKKRKLINRPQSSEFQETPPSRISMLLSSSSSADVPLQRTPAASRRRTRNSLKGEVNGETSTPHNGEIEITLTKLTTPGSKPQAKSPSLKKFRTPASEKKVAFALSKNRAQEADEYVKSVVDSPMIPYDASKRPMHGVLKPSAIASPINPFYVNNSRRHNKKRSI